MFFQFGLLFSILIFDFKSHQAPIVISSPNSPIPLLTLKSIVDVKSGLVKVSQTLTYQNVLAEPADIEYHFPLFEHSVFDSFFADVEGRLICGTIKERLSANVHNFFEIDMNIFEGFSEYNEVREIMRLSLGSLLPNQKITITLAYLERLTVILNHLMMFVLPEVPYRFSGKYLSPLSSAGRKPEDLVSSFPKESQNTFTELKNSNYSWEIRVTVTNSEALRVFRINCPTNQASYSQTEPGIFLVTLDNKKDQSKFKGFKLLIHFFGIHVPTIHLERHSTHIDSIVGRISLVPYLSDLDTYELLNFKGERNDDYKMLFNLFREKATGRYLFLLDYSHSMNEKKISIAKKCLKFLFRYIPPKITFNLISFAENYTSLFSEPVTSSIENIWVAIASLTGVQPSQEKKNLYAVLRSVLIEKKTRKSEEPLYLFLLSDGWSANQEQVLSLINTAKRIKIFPIGIGNITARPFLRKMAFLSNGFFTSIAPTNNDKWIERQLVNIYWKAISPYIADIVVKTSVDHLILDKIVSHSEDGFIMKEEEYECNIVLNATRFIADYLNKNITISIAFYNSHIDRTELHTITTNVKILTSGTVLHKIAYKLKSDHILSGLLELENPDLKLIIEEETIEFSKKFQILNEKTAYLIALPGLKGSKEKKPYYVPNMLSDEYMEHYEFSKLNCDDENNPKCEEEREAKTLKKSPNSTKDQVTEPISKFISNAIGDCLGLNLVIVLGLSFFC